MSAPERTTTGDDTVLARRVTRRAIAVLLAAALLVASACSGEEGAVEQLEIAGDPTPSAEASPSPTAAPTLGSGDWRVPGEDGDPDEEGHEVFVETTLRDPDKLEVAAAFADFWQVRLDQAFVAELDAGAIGEVATGQAAQNTVALIEGLRRREATVQGDMVLGIRNVRVRGGRATLSACVQNLSTDRGPDGEPVETLVPFYDMGADLVRSGGQWRMSELRASATFC